jgi:hypothetical protein
VSDVTAAADEADVAPTAVPQGVGAVRAMRARRRANRLGNLEWFEIAYQAYLTAFGVGVGILLAVGAVGDERLDEAGRALVLARGPAYGGLVAALALAAGLRSGSRGGPIALQPPDVRHVLLAPVERRDVLRPLALRQLGHGAFVGILAGAVAGLLLQRRMGGTRQEWAIAGAAAGVTVGVGWVGSALVASGLRLRRPVATAVALALIVGAVLDVARVVPWPTAALGSLLLWPARSAPEGLAAAALAVVLAVVGTVAAHRVRVEDAERRTALAGQLRFAVTTRDLRTVVVLHRLLAQDRPRHRPWFPVPRRPSDPSWRRSWHSVARFPLPRLARIVGLGAVGGLALGGVLRGSTPLGLAAALAFLVAALDLLEPLAQSRDQTDRTALVPMQRTLLYSRLVVVPAILAAVVVGGVAVAAVAPFATSAEAVAAAVAFPAAALAGLAGAVIVLVREERADLLDGQLLPPEVAGMREVFKTVIPLAVALTGCLPAVLTRTAHRLGDPIVPTALQATAWPVLVTALVLAWMHRRDDIVALQRRAMADARGAR